MNPQLKLFYEFLGLKLKPQYTTIERDLGDNYSFITIEEQVEVEQEIDWNLIIKVIEKLQHIPYHEVTQLEKNFSEINEAFWYGNKEVVSQNLTDIILHLRKQKEEKEILSDIEEIVENIYNQGKINQLREHMEKFTKEEKSELMKVEVDELGVKKEDKIKPQTKQEVDLHRSYTHKGKEIKQVFEANENS